MFGGAFVLEILEIVLSPQLPVSHPMASAEFLQVMPLGDSGNAMGQPWETRGTLMNAARCFCARCLRSSQAKMVYFETLYPGRRSSQTQEGMLSDF